MAAERLVGERGIAALSLREAAGSAGARNNSAAQYHFGTEDGLIDAIFELRMGTITRRAWPGWTPPMPRAGAGT